MLWKLMAVRLEWHRQRRGWLGHTWPQGHMRAVGVVMGYPLAQDPSHMVCGEWNQKVEALPPQRADKPLAERIGLRSPHRRLEHPQPQVTYASVQLLREDAIAVMYQASVSMVSGKRFAELLQGPRRCRIRRDIDMEDAARGVLHHHKHVEQAKRGGDHHTEITGHNG